MFPNSTRKTVSDLIPKHGGYRKLKSFQVAQLVCDVIVRFRDRYVDRRSRTHDQMVQAARSGVQNIAEGSQASATSKKTELKLTRVARTSLWRMCSGGWKKRWQVERLAVDFENKGEGLRNASVGCAARSGGGGCEDENDKSQESNFAGLTSLFPCILTK